MVTHSSILAWRIPQTEECGEVAKSHTHLKRLSRVVEIQMLKAKNITTFNGSGLYRIPLIFFFFEITTSATENSKDYTKGMRTLNKQLSKV